MLRILIHQILLQIHIFQHHKPNILINTAAYTDVNKAEIDKENAENINSKAVKMLAKYCKIYNTLFR